ncbi:uncharacterized protein LOC102443686 isoform X2 [Pelodiscus sinensis]|uniref:uncharacterized protein LOC102443686 isoform X2 n=1 Tax=Pelodiscus sinensis TaxID=13735 RepID=UPI0003C453BB|nr:uncharacterized protein LOC102443686 [Pelodiscus sinensis]|eukprot:XP_006130743.1 uncharacterized protein LOC102443686 [Pelodiscus sinensis]
MLFTTGRRMETRELDASFFKTALNKDEAENILSEISNLSMTERENGKYKKKSEIKYESLCPVPQNVLCLGLKTPRSASGILQLLPSEATDFVGEEHYSLKKIPELGEWSITTFKDHIIPTGRELPRTPNYVNQQGKFLLEALKDHMVLNERHPTDVIEPSRSECDAFQLQVDADLLEKLLKAETSVKTRASDTWVYPRRKFSICQHTQQPDDKHNTTDILENGKEVASPIVEDERNLHEQIEPLQDCPVPKCFTTTSTNRRISEIPVQGLNEMNVSMMINRIKDYQCTKEDIEFLRYMKNREQAQKLKAKYLHLQKELISVVQTKELLLAQRKKVHEEIVHMKASYDRTVELGRAFLGKRTDPDAVEKLPPKAVLGQLNPVKLQLTQQKEKAELQALQKELKMLKHSLAQLPQKQEIRLERGFCKQRIQEAEHSVQQAQEDVEHLKCKIEAARSKLAEVQVQLCNTRVEIEKWHTLKEKTTVSQVLENVQGFDNDYLKRRLNRLLRRTDIFLEREKIIKRLGLLE